MKKRTIIILISLILLIGIATGVYIQMQHNDAPQTQEDELDVIPGLEDIDGLSDDELNQRLIDEANQMEVVPDKKK